MVQCNPSRWRCYELMNVCACYHPPKPIIYDVALFRQQFINSAANILDDEPVCIIRLTGVQNKLNTSEMQTELDLNQIINAPTHINNALDVFVANRPDLLALASDNS